MATQFRPLPSNLFEPKVRPYIERLNRDLRDLYGLEGVLRNPTDITRRSDRTIVRRGEVQVDVSRITPSIAQVVSGSSTVIGVPNLTFSTTNIIGTTTTAIATDSTIAIFGTATPLGLSFSGMVGTSAFAARADHRHAYPDIIAASVLDYVTLTDDATEGALFTASASFAANSLSLKAPNATNAARFGKYGNISIAGTALTDQTMLQFVKTDFNEAVTGPIGINFTLTNTNIGDATAIVRGLAASVTGSMTGSTQISFGNIYFARATMSGGATGNTRFKGSVIAFSTAQTTVLSSVVGTTVVSVIDFQSGQTIITRSLVSDRIGFEARGSITLQFGGTLLNHYGFLCNALVQGSTRIQYEAKPITTGTPAIAYAFRSSLHTVGTLRRSFIGDNSFLCPLNNMMVGTSGMGFVVADTIDGNYYLISTASGVIGASSIGATLPAL